MSAGAPGERDVALALADILEDWGFRVDPVDDGRRPNVVARIGTATSALPPVLLNGHLDTVGVEGMVHAPWDAEQRDGRIYGRGSADMKAGLAALASAAARSAERGLAGEIIFAAVADEEYRSEGMSRLLRSGVTAGAALVAEPTRLAVCPAHRGFAWLELVVHGRAAHGSRWDVGIDAIALAALVIAELEEYQALTLTTRRHPLLGRPSLHASLVSGGIGLSTYPDRCSVQFERRTIPGESAADFAREVEQACARVRERRPELRADVIPGFSQEPNNVSSEHMVVRTLAAALRTHDVPVRVEGLSCWTDAALLTAAGIPAVCFGPGDIAVAHAAEEYVPVADIEMATAVVASWIGDWFRPDR